MINTIADIDRRTDEGKLLFAALAKITTESQRRKTPYEVLEQIKKLSAEIEKHSYEQIDVIKKDDTTCQ